MRMNQIATDCSIVTDYVFLVLFAYFNESMGSIGGYEPQRSWNKVGLTPI